MTLASNKVKFKEMVKVFLCVFLFVFSASGFSTKIDPKLKPVLEDNKPEIKKYFENNELNAALNKVILKNTEFEKEALIKAFSFFNKNKEGLKKEELCLAKNNKNNRKKIRNHSCMVVVDYSKPKINPRLLVVNPQTGESELFYSAHGKGSNEKGKTETGLVAKTFSNVSGSLQTSLGYYLTDELYSSRKDTFGPGPGNGLRMDGLSCTNNNARSRYIVMHTAKYVPELDGDKNQVGNSEGCVTLPKMRKDVLDKCKGGALVFAYGKN